MNHLKSLRQFIGEVWIEFQQAQLLSVASSLAYTTLLSLIPLLAVSFAIFQAFGGLERLYETLEPFLLQNLTQGSSEVVAEHLRQFIGNAHAGAIGASGFLGLFATSMSLLFSIDKAINRVWRAPENRSWFQRLASYWFFVTLGPMALAIAVGFVSSKELPIAKILPGKLGLALIATGLFTWLYKFVPNRKVHWKPAIISAVVTGVVWSLATGIYEFYTTKFVRYDKIYGSLGAIPILLLWIYLIWVIVLTGVATTAVLQKKYDVK
jgi:membrane protein